MNVFTLATRSVAEPVAERSIGLEKGFIRDRLEAPPDASLSFEIIRQPLGNFAARLSFGYDNIRKICEVNMPTLEGILSSNALRKDDIEPLYNAMGQLRVQTAQPGLTL